MYDILHFIELLEKFIWIFHVQNEIQTDCVDCESIYLILIETHGHC